MIVVACTGGIGAGKSTVASLLARRGAVVVDADALARDALEPGEPGYDAAVARFGPSILARGHAGARPPIDRARLASVVFSSQMALADLETIVHPVVRERARDVLRAHAPTDDVVVLDLPLLVDRFGQRHFRVDGVLVVDAPEAVSVGRLVGGRRMKEADVRARMASQPGRGERLREADYVIENLGTMAELEEMVAKAWEWIGQLQPDVQRAGASGDAARRAGHDGR